MHRDACSPEPQPYFRNMESLLHLIRWFIKFAVLHSVGFFLLSNVRFCRKTVENTACHRACINCTSNNPFRFSPAESGAHVHREAMHQRHNWNRQKVLRDRADVTPHAEPMEKWTVYLWSREDVVFIRTDKCSFVSHSREWRNFHSSRAHFDLYTPFSCINWWWRSPRMTTGWIEVEHHFMENGSRCHFLHRETSDSRDGYVVVGTKNFRLTNPYTTSA